MRGTWPEWMGLRYRPWPRSVRLSLASRQPGPRLGPLALVISASPTPPLPSPAPEHSDPAPQPGEGPAPSACRPRPPFPLAAAVREGAEPGRHTESKRGECGRGGPRIWGSRGREVVGFGSVSSARARARGRPGWASIGFPAGGRLGVPREAELSRGGLGRGRGGGGGGAGKGRGVQGLSLRPSGLCCGSGRSQECGTAGWWTAAASRPAQGWETRRMPQEGRPLRPAPPNRQGSGRPAGDGSP